MAAAAAEIEQSFCSEKEQVPAGKRDHACNSFSSPSSSLDCNICLDNVEEPVVTLCGHLFCWPCIYKWLHLDGKIAHTHCPVCKSAISQTSLVPLYGRGYAAGKTGNIPRRPSCPATAPPPPPQTEVRRQLSLLGGTAVGVLPWVLGEHWMGLYYTNPYQHLVNNDVEARRQRRREMRDSRSLHRISGFLFFCLILCLLLF